MLQTLNCNPTYTAAPSCAFTTWVPNVLFPPLMFAWICWLRFTSFAMSTTGTTERTPERSPERYSVIQHLLLRNVYTNQLYKAFEIFSTKYLHIFYYNSDWDWTLQILWLIWKQVINPRKFNSFMLPSGVCYRCPDTIKNIHCTNVANWLWASIVIKLNNTKIYKF